MNAQSDDHSSVQNKEQMSHLRKQHSKEDQFHELALSRAADHSVQDKPADGCSDLLSFYEVVESEESFEVDVIEEEQVYSEDMRQVKKPSILQSIRTS